MSVLTDALAAFAASDGGERAQRALFLAGARAENAHTAKHLDAIARDATDKLQAIAIDWKARIDAEPEERITRVLIDG